ncbi:MULTISPECIES: hypothetical protein [Rhizobium]|uniref:hypothetical protein n=1 Tax=Rhizobium TaxID=379 RepID=UPI002852E266|nr:hypothetical protein [Rhizobium favelukesii]
MTGNPLASPEVLGVSSGAGTTDSDGIHFRLPFAADHDRRYGPRSTRLISGHDRHCPASRDVA